MGVIPGGLVINHVVDLHVDLSAQARAHDLHAALPAERLLLKERDRDEGDRCERRRDQEDLADAHAVGVLHDLPGTGRKTVRRPAPVIIHFGVDSFNQVVVEPAMQASRKILEHGLFRLERSDP